MIDIEQRVRDAIRGSMEGTLEGTRTGINRNLKILGSSAVIEKMEWVDRGKFLVKATVVVEITERLGGGEVEDNFGQPVVDSVEIKDGVAEVKFRVPLVGPIGYPE